MTIFEKRQNEVSFGDALKALDQEWSNYNPQKFGVRDGRYLAIIDTARIQPNKFTDEPELFFELIVIEGEFAERKIFIHRPLQDKKKWFLVKNDLAVLGMEIPAISDIGNYLDQMLDVVVEVKAESKKYKNHKGEEKIVQNYELIRKIDERTDSRDDDMPF